MRTVVFGLAWAVAVVLASTGVVDAGSIGWSEPATDISDSMMGFASEGVPFAIGAGLLGAGCYLPQVVPFAMGGTVCLYGASNADQFQGILGGGGGGGLITALDPALVAAFQTMITGL